MRHKLRVFKKATPSCPSDIQDVNEVLPNARWFIERADKWFIHNLGSKARRADAEHQRNQQ
jgi:hypothetical protein